MSDGLFDKPDKLSLSVQRQLEPICEQFEAAWQSGTPPSITEYLKDSDPSLQAPLMRRLLELDVHYRRRAGEEPSRQAYQEQFPAGADLIDAVFSEQESLRETTPHSVADSSIQKPPQSQDGPLPTPHPEILSAVSRLLRSLRLSAEELKAPNFPELGKSIGDFEILEVLGKGAFGKVFLARQVSLDRHVALKVTANFGHEARTMARLQHDHIVQVFSEDIDASHNLRLLCMQYVAGATLERVIRELHRRDRDQWSGQTLLEILDEQSTEPPTSDPSALRDREELEQCHFYEAICWIGQRLAEALAYAHSQGVLHRDIKPANILLNQHGRPMLADFSLSFHAASVSHMATAAMGGTLAYMAPEHLDAFNPGDPAEPEVVDERSDIYSLGLVLFEAATAEHPFETGSTRGDLTDRLRTMSTQRRRKDVAALLKQRDVPEALARVIRRCLAPDPQRRYQTAGESAEALAGCRDLLAVERKMPPGGRLTCLALRSPFWFIVILTLVPNVSALTGVILYNGLFVVSGLPPHERSAFAWTLLAYNAVIVPVMLLILFSFLRPWARLWLKLRELSPMTSSEMADLRRRSFGFVHFALLMSSVGWFLYGPALPLGMWFLGDAPPDPAVWRITRSFLLIGLMALVHNYYVTAFTVVRCMYLRLWTDAYRLRETAAEELAWVGPRNRFFQVLVILIPLSATSVLIFGGPDQFTPESYRVFRITAILLMGVGFVGFWLSMTISGIVEATVATLTGAHQRSRR